MQGQAITPRPSELPLALAPAAGNTLEHSVLTPGDVRKIIIKRKWVILVCLLFGLLVAGYFAFLSTPLYEAVAEVDIDLGRSTNIGISDLVEQNLAGEDASSERLQTEVAIMRSNTVALDVINTLDLYHRKPFSEVFRDSPYNGHLTPGQRTALLKTFSGNLKIMLVPGTNLVEIRYRNPDPKLATSVTNAILDAYMERDLRARYEGTNRVSSWLSQQLSALKKQVEDSQQQVAQYQRANNLIGLNADGQTLVTSNLQTVNQQLAEAQADRIVKEARYRLAQTRNPELLVSVAPGTTLTALRQQQSELLVQYAQLKSKYGSDWPKVKEAEKQLAAVQVNIDTEINNLTNRFEEEYNTSVKTENLLHQRLEEIKQEAYHNNESAAEFEILKHGADSASDLYDALQTKLKEAGITAGLNSNNIDVVDRAAEPARPISPAKKRDLLFGLLGGLLLGTIAALFLESLDDTIRTSDDAEAISGLPSLAVIPHFDVLKKLSGSAELSALQKERNSKVSADLISYTEPQSVIAEGFRTLRSSLMLSAVDREPRLILLTSSFAAEGKSTCAANLAISFARRSARVLLVDSDLRKGTQHLKFKTSNRVGLSTLLSRESGNEVYEQPLPDLPNLTVVTRGPIAPNPGEMLASRSMEDLLLQWRLEYDHVILDTSPVLAVSDTLSLAPHMDAVFILVRSGVTRKKALSRVRDLLRRSNARLLGTVVNDVDLRLENYYTYSRRYDYDYSKGYGAGYGVTDEEK
ncbi:polysaccharide biosynthesis tyrosine autokinase [Alloacidobacterium dinghuense]|uniref:non-specific protein-tyrosine kinase n=1 Tax=Alloacidobacterium dinghuense TaxID=2763107 RepID=A0A7G8BMP1_9BACT|nr:polysaccharide biosynthesis tyrosine autokinase [Alloacidobacterium dinghuense]QNI33811.1 polysaccharide biosynthesis tyrosine autokinase [Alloacidobacterium dinghuense]